MKNWLVIICLLLCAAAIPVRCRADVTVYVGYYDTVSPTVFTPDPWNLSPNTYYLGYTGSNHNGGAILIRNTGLTNVVVSRGTYVDGFANGAKFQLWDSQLGNGRTLTPGQSLILAETAPGNFNTGDQPEIADSTNRSTAVPQIHVLLNNNMQTFSDTAQVLNTGGFDPADAYHRNKSMQWRPIGTTGITDPAGTGVYLTDVQTQHFDNYRSGLNSREATLSPSNVRQTTFGKLFSYPVDGQIYGQPLVLNHISLAPTGFHNLVYVATENNSVYAFDADDPTFNSGKPIWQTNLGPPVSASTIACNDIWPIVGITSTPVIDRNLQNIYVVAETYEQNTCLFRLHSLSMLTGKERPGSPVVIQATVAGSGNGSQTVTFDPNLAYQRPALLEANGVIYIGTASHCDITPFHGWLFGYDAKTLKQIAVFNTTPDGSDGGLWMSGAGPAVDASGNIFVSTGNGTFDATTTNRNYGDSILRINPTNGFTVADYFTPYNQALLSTGDGDVGSGGVLLLPDTLDKTNGRKLLVTSGKEGRIYVVNRDNMGHFTVNDDSQIVQSLPQALVTTFSMPAYFNGKIYYQGAGDTMKAFSFTKGQFNPIPSSVSQNAIDYPGATPWITAMGLAKPIVWTLENRNNVALLHAFDANDLTKELYNSGLNAGRDDLDGYVKFNTPVAVNGKVFVPTAASLAVFGGGYWATAPTISPAGGEYRNTVTLSMSSSTPNAQIYYTTDGSAPTIHSTAYTQPVVLTSSVTVRAISVASGFANSAVTRQLYTVDAGPGNGDGLYATYFSNRALDPTTGTTSTEIDSAINFNWNGGPPTTGIPATNWSARWTGHILPRASGVFTFYTDSAGGVRLWVNGRKIVDYWTEHELTENAGLVILNQGQTADITLEYYPAASGSQLALYWSSPGMDRQLVPQAQLYSGHTAKPSISPLGGVFAHSVPITLSDSTPGASLYYTLDGTTPTRASTAYTGPFTLTSSATVQAIAVAGSLLPSDVASASFTRNDNNALYRLNSGGTGVGTFTRDAFYTGGGTYSTTGSIDTSRVTQPAPQSVYLSERWGNFGYIFGGLAHARSYLVRLHFAEMYYSQAGQRLFNVAINGKPALSNFDIFASAGGSFTAISREFTVSPDSTGTIHVTFQSLVGDAKVSGIELIPQ